MLHHTPHLAGRVTAALLGDREHSMQALTRAAKKAEPPAVGAEVQARVELVQQGPNVLVASLPDHASCIAFASTVSLNSQHSAATPAFAVGQRLTATVSGIHAGRMLLQFAAAAPTAPSPGKAKAGPVAQAVVQQGVVKCVHAVHVDVKLSKGVGRMHACEVADVDASSLAQVRAFCCLLGVCPLLSSLHVARTCMGVRLSYHAAALAISSVLRLRSWRMSVFLYLAEWLRAPTEFEWPRSETAARLIA